MPGRKLRSAIGKYGELLPEMFVIMTGNEVGV